MFLPPAAAWTAGRSRWQQGALLTLAWLGAALCMWVASRLEWGASSVVLLALAGVGVASAVLGLRKAATGQLRWDGAHWYWRDTEVRAVSHLVCVIDLQRFLLLRVVCEPANVHWLWLESRSMDGNWLALRRAVVASRHAAQSVGYDSLPE